jgi:hypothetical protein
VLVVGQLDQYLYPLLTFSQEVVEQEVVAPVEEQEVVEGSSVDQPHSRRIPPTPFLSELEVLLGLGMTPIVGLRAQTAQLPLHYLLQH